MWDGAEGLPEGGGDGGVGSGPGTYVGSQGRVGESQAQDLTTEVPEKQAGSV